MLSGCSSDSRERPAKSWCCAQEEARALRHGHVGSEALLARALARTRTAWPLRALASFDVTLEKTRLRRSCDVSAPGEEPFGGADSVHATGRSRSSNTPATKRLPLNDKYVGTEHILLGSDHDR